MHLMMLTVADCRACEVQKAALQLLKCRDLSKALEITALTLGEIRALRKQGTRLIFPILQIVEGEKVFARRMGVAGNTVAEEAAAIDSWYSSLELVPSPARNVTT